MSDREQVKQAARLARELFVRLRDVEPLTGELVRQGYSQATIDQALEGFNLRYLEPLHTGPLMPALLIGYEVQGIAGAELGSSWHQLLQDRSLPPWLTYVAQQAGGYSMCYPDALGAVLRLEANRSFARHEPDHLIRGFHAMAEDPDPVVLREYPHLEALCQTRGDPLSQTQLDHFRRALSPYFDLPRPISGFEAFVRLQPCDLMRYFDGWHTVLVDEYYATLGYLPSWQDVGTFDSASLERLDRLGRHYLGVDHPPSAFFLWENCD
ncbi:MAG: hypothetical protein AB7S38_16985 [Vulcanimicrobiota bacterium]